MKLLKFKVNNGEEVIEILSKEFEENNIKEGAIVSVIGAVDSCMISNMPKNDAQKDILKEYNEPFEFSGTGEIKNGKPHIHCAMSGENNIAIHGHLHWAKVKDWYVTVFVIIN